MGLDFPPYYGVKSILSIVKEIAKIDEKINVLAIEREQLVTKLTEAIEKEDSKKA
jgi:hypothetical protein